MVYRNKTYIAFDGDNDMTAYRTLEMWKSNDRIEFDFYNAHDICSARDSSLTDSIKASLRTRMQNSKLFILLIGEHTKYLRRFVPWEIDEAKKLGLPIIAVNLNNSREKDTLCPATLNNELAIFVSFKARIINYAMKNWPDSDKKYRSEGKAGAYFYKDSVYQQLGI